MNETIYYQHGHTCVPNGVGDYTFVCPTLGKREGFVPYMMRTLLKGTCLCGQPVDLDEQPRRPRGKGVISPCPKCDSPEVDVELIERVRKYSSGMKEFSYARKVTCLDCGHTSPVVPGIPPYIGDEEERKALDAAWADSVKIDSL